MFPDNDAEVSVSNWETTFTLEDTVLILPDKVNNNDEDNWSIELYTDWVEVLRLDWTKEIDAAEDAEFSLIVWRIFAKL
jgi:hypothetical protein